MNSKMIIKNLNKVINKVKVKKIKILLNHHNLLMIKVQMMIIEEMFQKIINRRE